MVGIRKRASEKKQKKRPREGKNRENQDGEGRKRN